MAGYTRQSSGDIVTGNTIQASHFNNEFEALEDAFDGTSGHVHDGTAGNAPQIVLTTSVSGILPVANGGTNAATAADARTSLGLTIGTDVQAYDAGLASIAGLTTSADKMIYTTASDTYAVTALTSFARSILDDANASAVRTTIGLGSIATQASSSVTITGGTINGVVIGGTTPAAGTFTTLTANGNTTIGNASGDTLTINAATVSIANGLNFDSNTFVIDAANNRIGIGTTSPSVSLHTVGDLRVQTSQGNVTIESLGSSGDAIIRNSVNSLVFDSTGANLEFRTGNTERARIDASGNFLVGTTSVIGSTNFNFIGTNGRMLVSSSATASTNKTTQLYGLSYNNSIRTLLYANLASNTDTLAIGGGVSAGNPVDKIVFYANSFGSTGAGTERMRLTPDGLGIGTTNVNAPFVVSSGVDNLQARFGSVTTDNIDSIVRFQGRSSTGTIRYADIQIDANNNLFTLYAPRTAAPNIRAINIHSSGAIGIGTTSPHSSALVDIQSTTKGLRLPNMTTTQKNAISSPAAGLLVFDTTLGKACVYTGSAWQTITSA